MLPTGVHIIEGLPGSGKTFKAVRDLERILIADRRPVFTNLPLRWRRFRALMRLRGGRGLADLVHELDRDHFLRFLRRLDERTSFMNANKDLLIEGRPITGEQLEELWYAHAGPDVLDGRGANWISLGALVVIDEAQNWFPQAEQSKGETPLLQRYLTMHRHCGHMVWAITQERVLLSIAFRKVCEVYWLVKDLTAFRVLWCFRFRDLGLWVIGYYAFSSSQEAGKDIQRYPLERAIVLPKLPCYRYVFSLYRSFTHAGGLEQIERAVERERARVGLVGSAEESAEESQSERTVAMRSAFKMLRGLLALSCALLVGFALGVVSGEGHARSPAAAPAARAPAQAVAEAPGVVRAAGPPALEGWGRWTAAADGVVYIDGVRYVRGQSMASGPRLEDVSPDGRTSVWSYGGDLWLWNYGEARPQRLGPVGLVMAVLANARGARGGGGEPAAGVAAGGPVDAAAGEPGRGPDAGG